MNRQKPDRKQFAREAADTYFRDGDHLHANAIRDTLAAERRLHDALADIDTLAYSALHGSKTPEAALNEIRAVVTKALS